LLINERLPLRLATKTYDESGKLITEWDEDKGWFEDGTEQNECGEWLMNRIYHLYTEEQLEEIQREKEKAALEESRRQLTLSEVTALFIKSAVNTIDIPDQTSLRMMDYYPAFSEIIGQTVKLGFKFVHEGVLYKTAQSELLIQSHYLPGDGTESLYTRIDITHTGAIYDPIPYDGNMELFNGKYYIQNGEVYFCTRDTQSPVFHSLSDLVGIYTESTSIVV
jgi:hypothetical protein